MVLIAGLLDFNYNKTAITSPEAGTSLAHRRLHVQKQQNGKA